jgi:tetratricopeptide (TPR) repeat protein
VFILLSLFAATALSGCSTSFTHVKPGQSAWLSLAVSPNVIGTRGGPAPVAMGPSSMPGRPLYPDLHLSLPSRGSGLENSGDIFSSADFAMQTGQIGEAIAAYEGIVRQQPTSGIAWRKLASLYERAGDTKSAIRAFKEAKKCQQPDPAANNPANTAVGLR